MEMKQILGQNLKKYRKARGLKQSELAKMIGVSMYTVSVWERGKQMPEVKAVEALSRIFSVPPQCLYLDEDELERAEKDNDRLDEDKWRGQGMSVFGEKLKELRRQYDLTQKDLAENLGVTKGTVAKWEQGVRYPELGMIEKMAKAFHVSIGELLNEEEKRKNPAEVFAKRVRELRKQKGITQDDLADALCISKFSVSAWERGLRCPESSTVEMLAGFFGVPERYFFSDIDEPPVTDVEAFLSKKVAKCLTEQFGTTDCAGDYIISISIRKVNEEGERGCGRGDLEGHSGV